MLKLLVGTLLFLPALELINNPTSLYTWMVIIGAGLIGAGLQKLYGKQQ